MSRVRFVSVVGKLDQFQSSLVPYYVLLEIMLSFANSILGSLPPIMTGSPARSAADGLDPARSPPDGLESTDCSERYDDHYTDLPAIPGATKRSPRKEKSISKGEKSPKSKSSKSRSAKSRSEGDGNESDSSSSSGSSYSSGSDTESVFSKATESSTVSYTYNAKRAIALTAMATTNSIDLSATKSAKMTSLEKQIKSDMKNHNKQVLIERGVAVPHVRITVDAKCAHEFEVQARKTAEVPHVKGCNANHTLQKLQRQGVPTDLAHDLEHNIDMEKQEVPSFAKKTVAGLIVDHATTHKEPAHKEQTTST